MFLCQHTLKRKFIFEQRKLFHWSEVLDKKRKYNKRKSDRQLIDKKIDRQHNRIKVIYISHITTRFEVKTARRSE